MLAFHDGTIVETWDDGGVLTTTGATNMALNVQQTSNCLWYSQPYTYWNSYPVYICTDKTKKAIEVLKALQAEKLLKCDSVPRFIELVEKISAIL